MSMTSHERSCFSLSGIALVAGLLVAGVAASPLAAQSGTAIVEAEQQLEQAGSVLADMARWEATVTDEVRESCRTSMLEVHASLALIAESFGRPAARDQAQRALQVTAELSSPELNVYAQVQPEIDALRDALAQLMAVVASPGAGALSHASTAGDGDSPGDSDGFPDAAYVNFPFFDPTGLFGGDPTLDPDQRFSSELTLAGEAILFAADALDRTSFDLANQIVVAVALGNGGGGNISASHTPISLAVALAKSLFNVIILRDASIDSSEIEGTYDRMGHLHDDVEQLQDGIDLIVEVVQRTEGKVDILDDKVDLLAQEVERLRKLNCELVRLLHTPPKKRASVCDVCDDQPGFPYEYANKKN